MVKSLVVLVDTREKSNNHITEWFSKKKIPYESKALSNGDYSFYIPKQPELNIDRSMLFDKETMIERKASLDELSGNLAQNRDRFEKAILELPTPS